MQERAYFYLGPTKLTNAAETESFFETFPRLLSFQSIRQDQLRPTFGKVLCGPVRFQLQWKFCTYILTTCPCFDNLEFDIFDAGSPQCTLPRLLPFAVRIRALSVH